MRKRKKNHVFLLKHAVVTGINLNTQIGFTLFKIKILILLFINTQYTPF